MFYNIISGNVGGIRPASRQEIATNFFKLQKADFSILMESHISFKQYNGLKNMWDGDIYYAPGKELSAGITLLTSPKAPEITNIDTDQNGRYLIFDIKNTKDTVLAIYAPSGVSPKIRKERANFFSKIEKKMENRSKKTENCFYLEILTQLWKNQIDPEKQYKKIVHHISL